MYGSMKWAFTLAILAGLAASCAPQTAPATATATPVPPEEPHQITGTYSVTNDFVLATYYVENAVALLDMHGFVIRDKEWELPVDSQVLGYMTFDPETLSGTYELSLPKRPEGELNDVDNDGSAEAGVQVFAIGYSPNLSGGPFSVGDDRSLGWPTYLVSVRTDAENKDEVIGGRLVIWAPDANQQFPTGFGEDGLLFTADDPVGPLPAGFSIVDLDQKPFRVFQEAAPELTLYEPADIAIKDFSSLSYAEAFDRMFEVLRREYAFNGVEGKQPDWDAVYSELRPRLEEAERTRDANAFYLVLRDLTRVFKDGHVGLVAGDYQNQDFQTATSGGYGFAVRQLDDGRVIVIFVLEEGPAALAGMKVGAEITEFNGKPMEQALNEVQTYSNQSSDFAIRLQQTRYLLAVPPGAEASVTFVNPGESAETVTLTAIEERESFNRTSLYYGVDRNPMLPVEFDIFPMEDALIGYVKINSNYDDLNLIIRLFERALQTFDAYQVRGIIIDMRYNSGGAPLGLAGFLTDQEIDMGQLEYFSDQTGRFEPEGPREKVYPNENQYRFEQMALLVGPACFSACEIEAYGFSRVPGMMVVGQYPTAGVEAETARGQFSLPEDFTLVVPTGRFTLPDGSIFLEGQGVQPTIKVPVNESTVLTDSDVVLQAALDAILK